MRKKAVCEDGLLFLCLFLYFSVLKENKIVIYQTEDGQTQIDVRLENETVWLTQAQMAELYKKDQSVIARHLNNAFKEGELDNSNMHFLHNTRYKYRPTKTIQYMSDLHLELKDNLNYK